MCLGCNGIGFRVWGSEFRVQRSGFRGQGLGFRFTGVWSVDEDVCDRPETDHK